MASLQDIMNAPQKERGTGFSISMVHYSKLIPSEANNYSVDNIEKLAQAILMSGGVKQNLLVRKKSPDEYELISGHRRRLAVKYIVEELGHPEYAMLPVHVEQDSDLQAEVELILANCSARERSDWEKMMEVDRLTELMRAMQTGSDEEQERFRSFFGQEPGLNGRELRKIVADRLGLSETKVANLNHISSSLAPELMDRFQAGDIGVTVANEAASLSLEEQQELAEKEKIHIADVRSIKPVSESDTEYPEEEQLPGQMSIEDFPDILPEGQQEEETVDQGLGQNEVPAELTIAECARAFWSNMYPSEQNMVIAGQVGDLKKVLKKEYGESGGHDMYDDISYDCNEHKIDFTDTKTGLGLVCTWSELAMALVEYAAGAGQQDEDLETEQPAAPEHGDDAEIRMLEAAGWFDAEILKRAIAAEKRTLADIQKMGIDDMNIAHIYARSYMVAEALKDYLERHRSGAVREHRITGKDWEQRAAGQAPFPAMKNNDQREAWLDGYAGWPVWFEVPEADETYYRYDLPDGNSIVVCEYKLFLEWKAKIRDMDPESMFRRYYILIPGYHHLADCASTRTGILEKLKKQK